MGIRGGIETAFEWFMDNVGVPVFMIVVVIFVAALIVLPVMLFLNRNDVPTWTLRQDEWICTSGHTRKQEVCGKGCRWEIIQVCDAFERKTSENQ